MIARELVTRLSFSFDRSNLDKFERSLVGIKTKIAVFAYGLQAFATKTLDYFDSIAAGVRQTQNLANETGIAVNQFVALRRAAESFQFKPDQFNAAFSKLAELLRNGKRGFGELFEIQRRAGGKLNLIQFSQNNDVQGAFNEVLQYISSIDNLNDRLHVLQDIFGVTREAAHGLNNIVKAGVDVFNEATIANEKYGDSYLKQIPKTQEYEKNVLRFYNAIENITVYFVENILPYVSKFIDNITASFETLERLKGVFSIGGIKEGILALDKQVSQGVKSFFGKDDLSLLKEGVQQENSDFYQRVSEHVGEKAALNVNNTIAIEVAPGTNEQQAIDIATATQKALEDFNNKIVREILSNNPQVE